MGNSHKTPAPGSNTGNKKGTHADLRASGSSSAARGTAHAQRHRGSQNTPIASLASAGVTCDDNGEGRDKSGRESYSRPLTDAQALDLLTSHRGLAEQYQQLCAARLGEYKTSLQAQYNERLIEIEDHVRKWCESINKGQGAAAQASDPQWQCPVARDTQFEPSVPVVRAEWHQVARNLVVARPLLWTDETGLVKTGNDEGLLEWLREAPLGFERYLDKGKRTPEIIKLKTAMKEYKNNVRVIIERWKESPRRRTILHASPHSDRIVVEPTRDNMAVLWQLYSLLGSRKVHLVESWALQDPDVLKGGWRNQPCNHRVGKIMSRLGPKSYLQIATDDKEKLATMRRVVIGRPRVADQGTKVIVEYREIRTGAVVQPEAGDITVFEQERTLIELKAFFNSIPPTQLAELESWTGPEPATLLQKAPDASATAGHEGPPTQTRYQEPPPAETSRSCSSKKPKAAAREVLEGCGETAEHSRPNKRHAEAVESNADDRHTSKPASLAGPSTAQGQPAQNSRTRCKRHMTEESTEKRPAKRARRGQRARREKRAKTELPAGANAHGHDGQDE